MFTVDSTGQQAATTFSSMRVVGNNIYTAGVSVRIVDSVVTNSGIFSSFDMAGNMLKNTYFGVIPINSDFKYDVLLAEPNNQFILLGINANATINFIKVDKTGNTLLKRVYTSPDSTLGYYDVSNLIKMDNKYVFATRTGYVGRSYVQVYITDTLGTPIRIPAFNSSESYYTEQQVLKNKKNNLILCLNHRTGTGTDTNYVYFSELREIDTLGNTLWTHKTPRNRFIYFKKVIELANGNYLVAGDEEKSTVIGLYRNVIDVQPYLAEINPQRGIVWEKQFGIRGRIYGLKLLKDSSIILACSFSDGLSNSTACLLKLNKNKDSLYRRNFRATAITSGNQYLIPSQIEELDNGDLVIGGWAQDLKNRTLSVTSGQWGWLVRTDSLGCSLEPSSCRTPTKEIQEYPLSIKAYPNPTSGSLTVDFDIPITFKTAQFSLIDIAGREVLHQKIENGQKQVIWQTESLPQGLYFVILKVDNEIVYQTKVSVQK